MLPLCWDFSGFSLEQPAHGASWQHGHVVGDAFLQCCWHPQVLLLRMLCAGPARVGADKNVEAAVADQHLDPDVPEEER